jgi:oligopeptide/dipeptide ABC transporter ATP-binding protein
MDEPTASLDLSMQAQILNLVSRLRKTGDVSFVLISHDLAIVRHLADRVAVLYLGRIVETGPAETVFERPMHPYTETLVAAYPSLETIGRLPPPVKGEALLAGVPGSGCRYAPRCRFREAVCDSQDPAWQGRTAHRAACHFAFRELGTHGAKTQSETKLDA